MLEILSDLPELWIDEAIVPRLKVREIGAHLVCATLRGPGLDGAIVLVKHDKIVKLASALG